jgi:hypothetical protein
MNNELISDHEMADIIQKTINQGLMRPIADPPADTSFELTAPATGQRFRVTVAEVSPIDAVDEAIAMILGR